MDKATFKVLLLSLAAFELALIVGSFVLLYSDKTVPDWMSTAIAAVITGILGLAVHTSPPEPSVQVVTAPAALASSAPIERVIPVDDGANTLN